jgi:hypothetical protein
MRVEAEEILVTRDDIYRRTGDRSSEHMVVVWVATHSGNGLGLDEVREFLDGAANLRR